MPISVTAADDDGREDFLRAYVTTYLSEEVRAESLVRDLGRFSRFLGVAALAAGQTTNVSNIARDAAVSPRNGTRLLRDPRRHLDRAVAPRLQTPGEGEGGRACQVLLVRRGRPPRSGRRVRPASTRRLGRRAPSEHLVLHELQSYLHDAGVKGSLGYWATPSGREVDFGWWRGAEVVAIEAKHGHGYRREYKKGLDAFLAGRRARSYIVYGGTQELEIDATRVLPLERFPRRDAAGPGLPVRGSRSPLHDGAGRRRAGPGRSGSTF